MSEDFLPNDYEVPVGDVKYMKFEIGENMFRILSSPILGWEGWLDTEDGGRKPVRKRYDQSIVGEELGDPEKIKHFWAMVVWNYAINKIQILEITQKGIQKTLRALAKKKEWGSPKGYDVSVIRSGEGLNTEYEVVPAPPKKLSKEIKEAYESVDIKLEALFDNGDPFTVDGEKLADEVDKADKAS